MWKRLLKAAVAGSLMCMLLVVVAHSGSKQIPSKTVELLETKFMMSVALAIAKTKGDLKSATGFFGTNSQRFKHVGTQDQGEMRVEGYSVMDISSAIIGYSLFFYKTSDSLAIIDTSINPQNKEAVKNVAQLTKNSLDSTATGSNTKLYFLGTHDLDSRRLLKIMLREARTPMGLDYAIRYAISSK